MVEKLLANFNWENILILIKKYGNHNIISTGINEKRENIILSICENYLKTVTCLNNGWLRINIYYDDKTSEEFYEK